MAQEISGTKKASNGLKRTSKKLERKKATKEIKINKLHKIGINKPVGIGPEIS
jgi:hypothetical protein